MFGLGNKDPKKPQGLQGAAAEDDMDLIGQDGNGTSVAVKAHALPETKSFLRGYQPVALNAVQKRVLQQSIQKIKTVFYSQAAEDHWQQLIELLELQRIGITAVTLGANAEQFDLSPEALQQQTQRLAAALEKPEKLKLLKPKLASAFDAVLKRDAKDLKPEHFKTLKKDLVSVFKEHVRRFNIPKLRQLARKGAAFAKAIEGQDVIIVVGDTGAGKTTTIQILMDDAYRTPDEEPVNKARNTAVQGFKVGHSAYSETKSLQAVDLAMSTVSTVKTVGENYKKANAGRSVYMCDTPGFGDFEGVEVSVYNSKMIAEGLQKARSLRILAVHGKGQDRGESFAGLLQNLSKMFPNIAKAAPSMHFAFTCTKETLPPKQVLALVSPTHDNGLKAAQLSGLADRITLDEGALALIDHLHRAFNGDQNKIQYIRTAKASGSVPRRVLVESILARPALDPKYVHAFIEEDADKALITELEAHNQDIRSALGIILALKPGATTLKDVREQMRFIQTKLDELGFIGRLFPESIANEHIKRLRQHLINMRDELDRAVNKAFNACRTLEAVDYKKLETLQLRLQLLPVFDDVIDAIQPIPSHELDSISLPDSQIRCMSEDEQLDLKRQTYIANKQVARAKSLQKCSDDVLELLQTKLERLQDALALDLQQALAAVDVNFPYDTEHTLDGIKQAVFDIDDHTSWSRLLENLNAMLIVFGDVTFSTESITTELMQKVLKRLTDNFDAAVNAEQTRLQALCLYRLHSLQVILAKLAKVDMPVTLPDEIRTKIEADYQQKQTELTQIAADFSKQRRLLQKKLIKT